ncbi:hypothetical protein [Oxynema aestuarii]|uniref:Uncharacterized protein n=1 Tax=Oxynema aestuarii AP17 TaxID=2064643 RepID=A0A6H1TST1_9CYAN|nr:hypothetical protein [Oxynema aestuarii]QIZ69601.1 hypothetical protein HCG48_02540 [Oxynema aestuarii AP17]
MTSPSSPENLGAKNERSLVTLHRAISSSQGEFSLILVSCNCPHLQQQIANRLSSGLPNPPERIVLSSDIQTLYTTIATFLRDRQPPALMIFGLNAVKALDRVLKATNLSRHLFVKFFHFPLILWVDDRVIRELIYCAPDFKNYCGGTIRFDTADKSSPSPSLSPTSSPCSLRARVKNRV